MPEERLGECFNKILLAKGYRNGRFKRHQQKKESRVYCNCTLSVRTEVYTVDGSRSHTTFFFCQTFDFATKTASGASALVIPQLRNNKFLLYQWHL